MIDALAESAGASLVDLHSDPHHHRSVLTLAGPDVERSVQGLAVETVRLIDLRRHAGSHPRLGALDVVPFVALGAPARVAVEARDRFAAWAAEVLRLPCFLYGPERSLPEVRRGAFGTLSPDTGPSSPHPTAGAAAVGARPPLVAYNLWMANPDVRMAREVASQLRSRFAHSAAQGGPAVRALGLEVGGAVQVSCNLLDPWAVGPSQVYDAVPAETGIARAELVGLIPASALDQVPEARWEQLDLSLDRTIEARLARAERA